jgi:hypothetical protein
MPFSGFTYKVYPKCMRLSLDGEPGADKQFSRPSSLGADTCKGTGLSNGR